MVIYEHVKGVISVPCYDDNGNYAGYTNDIAFTENDIIKDSCSITSRACDDNTFSLGGVRPAELSIKLRLEGDGINAYNLYGAKIILYSCYAEHPKESDWVFRGTFWVTSVTHNKSVYTLRASDAIVWLDSGSYSKDTGKKIENEDSPIVKALSSSIYTLSSGLDFTINIINDELQAAGIDKISQYQFQESYRYENIFLNILPPYGTGRFGWVIQMSKDGYSSSYTQSEYVRMMGELMAGFTSARIIDDAEADGNKIQMTPFGYENAEEGYGVLSVPYENIEQGTCDIAGYTLYFQNVYAKTNDQTGWSTYLAPKPYAGNLTVDLSDNAFLNGRWGYVSSMDGGIYANASDYNVFITLNTIAAHLRSTNLSEQESPRIFRPFNLKCYQSFQDWKSYPKIGMKVRIEDETGKWKYSILTKVIWKFRGGWELGCAGKDSRVLSQAAKKSLASHAEDAAKTYAHAIGAGNTAKATEALNTANAAWNYADTAQQNANSRLDINDWNTIQGQIQDLWNAINA